MNQEWSLDFVDKDYDDSNIIVKVLDPKESNTAKAAYCHKLNLAFSATFEEFATEI